MRSCPWTPPRRWSSSARPPWTTSRAGGGSGDVTVVYTRNLYDGLTAARVPLCEALSAYCRDYVSRRYAAGDRPGLMAGPELPENLLREARAFSDTAVIVLSRFSGEGWDRGDVSYQEPGNPWTFEGDLRPRNS